MFTLWLLDMCSLYLEMQLVHKRRTICTDWLICNWVRYLTVPMHLGLNWQALCPHINSREPCCFTKVPDGSHTHTVDVLWIQEEGAQYTCLSEAKASHSQRMWAKVSSSAPRLLHNRLSDSPIRWRCLLRVLCPFRRPVTAQDCVLLEDRNIALAPKRRPEINSWTCLWVLPRPRHRAQCWLTNQCLILLLISGLETP